MPVVPLPIQVRACNARIADLNLPWQSSRATLLTVETIYSTMDASLLTTSTECVYLPYRMAHTTLLNPFLDFVYYVQQLQLHLGVNNSPERREILQGIQIAILLHSARFAGMS